MTAASPPILAEVDYTLPPLADAPAERPLSLATRTWQRAWVRKGVILLVLALLWELIARWQNNDLLLPTFVQTARAFVEGLFGGELLQRARASLFVLLQGYLLGIVAAFVLTTLAVSSQI